MSSVSSTATSPAYVSASALSDRASLLRHISTLAEQLSKLQLAQTIGPRDREGDEQPSRTQLDDLEDENIALRGELDRHIQQLAEAGLLHEALRRKNDELEAKLRSATEDGSEMVQTVHSLEDQLRAERDFTAYLALIVDPTATASQLEETRSMVEDHHARSDDLPEGHNHRAACSLQRHCIERIAEIFQQHQAFIDEVREREMQFEDEIAELQSRARPEFKVVNEHTSEHQSIVVQQLISFQQQREAVMDSAMDWRLQAAADYAKWHETEMMRFAAQWYDIQWRVAAANLSVNTSNSASAAGDQPSRNEVLMEQELEHMRSRCSDLEQSLSREKEKSIVARAEAESARREAEREASRVEKLKAWEAKTLDELHHQMATMQQRILDETKEEIIAAYEQGVQDGQQLSSGSGSGGRRKARGRYRPRMRASRTKPNGPPSSSESDDENVVYQNEGRAATPSESEGDHTLRPSSHGWAPEAWRRSTQVPDEDSSTANPSPTDMPPYKAIPPPIRPPGFGPGGWGSPPRAGVASAATGAKVSRVPLQRSASTSSAGEGAAPDRPRSRISSLSSIPAMSD